VRRESQPRGAELTEISRRRGERQKQEFYIESKEFAVGTEKGKVRRDVIE
jgi:hypothetical protein